MKVSARNVLPGTIVATTSSASTLKLEEGTKVYGVIKASSVMVATD